MHVVIAPNGFRDGLSALEVAEGMAEGVRDSCPRATIDLVPLADGGDGTLDVLLGLLGGRQVSARVTDPLGRPVTARWGLADDGQTAVVGVSEAGGLWRVEPAVRDPLRSSTWGTGQTLREALDRGARRFLIAAGGSATIDGGAGALAALGAAFLDARGRRLHPTPEHLGRLARVATDDLDERLRNADITVLGDVRTPLARNAAVYGAQKGLRPGDGPAVARAVAALAVQAAARGVDLTGTPWLGAGGGLAGGFAAFLGARAVGGAGYVTALARLPERLDGADLVLTGEGRVDATTAEGKLPWAVAALAAAAGVPVALLAGQVDRSAPTPPGVAVFGLSARPCTLAEAIAETAPALRATAAQVVRLRGFATPAARRAAVRSRGVAAAS